MKRLFVSDNRILVLQLRDFLEANHVRCLVRNEFLGGAAGELPPTECWPELWVIENIQYQKATELLEAFQRPTRTDPSKSCRWTCGRCQETLEAQFSQCWKCGYERPVWELPD